MQRYGITDPGGTDAIVFGRNSGSLIKPVAVKWQIDQHFIYDILHIEYGLLRHCICGFISDRTVSNNRTDAEFFSGKFVVIAKPKFSKSNSKLRACACAVSNIDYAIPDLLIS